jgi:hypothetical protein
MSREQQDILKAIEMSLNTVEQQGGGYTTVSTPVYRGEDMAPGVRTHYYPRQNLVEEEQDDELARAIRASLQDPFQPVEGNPPSTVLTILRREARNNCNRR